MFSLLIIYFFAKKKKIQERNTSRFLFVNLNNPLNSSSGCRDMWSKFGWLGGSRAPGSPRARRKCIETSMKQAAQGRHTSWLGLSLPRMKSQRTGMRLLLAVVDRFGGKMNAASGVEPASVSCQLAASGPCRPNLFFLIRVREYF